MEHPRTNPAPPRIPFPWLVALFLAAFGCNSTPGFPDLPDLSHLPPGEVVRVHVQRENAVQTLQGEVKAKLESPKRSGTVRASILVKRPDAFRMRAYFAPVGGTIFDMAIRKNRIQFYVPDEDTLYVQKLGRAEGEGPEGERGRGGEGEEAEGEKGPDLDALFGATGLSRLILGTGGDEVVFRFIDRSEDGLKLAVVNQGGIVEGYVWLHPIYLCKLRQEVLGRGGRKELVLDFSKYLIHEPTGILWPGRMEIRAPDMEFRMVMTFSPDDLTLNEPIENDLFEIDVPDEVKRVERD